MKALLIAAPLALLATSALAEPVTVDNCGTELAFASVPERVVVHDINMSEMAFALGLQDKIVGLTGITGWYKTSPDFDEKRGDIPELAPKYPTMENLIAASPDLFVAGWYYGMRPGGEVTPDTLEAQGIQTLVLTESCVHLHEDRPVASMDLLFDDMVRLGTVFDKKEEAEALVAGWKSDLLEIDTAIPDENRLRVFLYDSGTDKPFTAGRYAITTAMIEAAGGKNVMSDMETSWGTTSWEAVAATNPQFLVLLDYQDGSGAEGLMKFLKEHPIMSLTDAVQNERYVPLRYEELTPGPSNIAAISKIAEAMYPGSF
ncbi:ABC transporter substrate-binding protein [Roseibium sp.]|uniref:ABC transporter substrate-binding protein n=1 Tax=Roseibium sp. TaxID=1936156 RepID=UPI003B50CD7B